MPVREDHWVRATLKASAARLASPTSRFLKKGNTHIGSPVFKPHPQPHLTRLGQQQKHVSQGITRTDSPKSQHIQSQQLSRDSGAAI